VELRTPPYYDTDAHYETEVAEVFEGNVEVCRIEKAISGRSERVLREPRVSRDFGSSYSISVKSEFRRLWSRSEASRDFGGSYSNSAKGDFNGPWSMRFRGGSYSILLLSSLRVREFNV
jgi:hypothetical protein